MGKRVRSETKIDQKAVSISYAAIELAKKYCPRLKDMVCLFWRRENEPIAAKYLTLCGIKTIIVSNRSYDKACSLADRLGGKAIRFQELKAHFPDTDIIISCTGAPSYILKKAD